MVALTAFLLIVPVELPDKTFVATLVLSTRYPPLPVWLGVVAAFGIQCAVAVGGERHVLQGQPEILAREAPDVGAGEVVAGAAHVGAGPVEVVDASSHAP